jgi:hypothetical protein
METKVYVSLKTPIAHVGNTYDELRINVGYQKGGVNYFSGNIENSGVFVYLTPVHRSGISVGQTICGDQHISGYKILCKPLNRKSQKQINLVAEKVLTHASEIADLYSDYKHREVVNLIKTLVLGLL